MMNARIVLATTPNLDVYQWKRSKSVDWYVHLPHTVDELLGYRMFGMDSYDAVLLTGEYQGKYIRALEKMRSIPAKELKTVGSTYMDEMKKRLESAEKPKHEIPQILLAPSWGKSAILSKYGEKILDALIQTDYKIVVRPHPQTLTSEKEIIEPLQEKYKDSANFEWNYDNDNFNVLNESDLLITDFSGIILDYTLIFGKPLIYADTSLDNSPYDAAWFDEPVWRLQILPELGTKLDEKDFTNIKAVIDDALKSETFKNGRKRVRSEAWQNKGNAAVAVADYMVEKLEEIQNQSEKIEKAS